MGGWVRWVGAWMTFAAGIGAPPPNLDAGAFRSLTETMWRQSPTFRQQCARLAHEPALRVTITANIPRSPSHARATTTVRLSSGTADIVLLTTDDIVELIGHELEHVIEQLEGVDLRINSCDGSRNPPGRYESCRAIEAGRQVAREVDVARQRERKRVRRWPGASRYLISISQMSL